MVGDIVYVRPDNAEYWIAELLEIRAVDPAHVFLRIFWLYRPEDLPEGRQGYHGDDEVIPSNQMQIIDAMTINSKVDSLSKYNEEDDSALTSGYDDFLWRQTLNIRSTSKALSVLRTYCVCEQPSNPNVALIKCDQPKCDAFWMHQACLIDAAVQKTYNTALQKSCTEREEDGPALKTPEKDDPDVDEVGGANSITVSSRPSGFGSIIKTGFHAVNSMLHRSLSPYNHRSEPPGSKLHPQPPSGRFQGIEGLEEDLKNTNSSKPSPSPSQPVESIEIIADTTNDLLRHVKSTRKAVTTTASRKKGRGRPKKASRKKVDEGETETQDVTALRQRFSATLLGLSDKNGKSADGKLRIEIEDLGDGSSRAKKWTEQVACLRCGHELD